MSTRIRVLFVCLGNICRSPVAEGVFVDRIRRRRLDHRFEVDSAGLGAWHAGELPDERARRVAAKNGVSLPSRARKVDDDEFARWDWIVCMDEQNRRGLEGLGAPAPRVRLLKSFSARPVGASIEVDDPYQEGPEAFDRMFAEIVEAVEHFIDHLVKEHALDDAAPDRSATAKGDAPRSAAPSAAPGAVEPQRGA